MKEIRAYVRAARGEHVASVLAQEGFDCTVLDVQRIAHGLARSAYDYSVALGSEYERIVRIEVVCSDADAERLVELVRQAATTGRRGDGMIFVAPIDDALRISSGQRGEAALHS